MKGSPDIKVLTLKVKVMYNRTEFGGRPESCTLHFQLSSSVCLLSCQLRGWRCRLVPGKQYGHSLRRSRQQSPQWPTGSPLLSHPSTGVTSMHSSSTSLSTTGSLSPSHQVVQTITSKEKSQSSDGFISRKTVFSTYTVIIHKLSPEIQPLLPPGDLSSALKVNVSISSQTHSAHQSPPMESDK